MGVLTEGDDQEVAQFSKFLKLCNPGFPRELLDEPSGFGGTWREYIRPDGGGPKPRVLGIPGGEIPE